MARNWTFKLKDGTEAALRMPRFSMIGQLQRLLSSVGDGDEGLPVERFIAAAGYATSMCWMGDAFKAGAAPPLTGTDGYTAYGNAIADELQDHGWELADLYAAVESIGSKIGEQMTGVAEDVDEGKKAAGN